MRQGANEERMKERTRGNGGEKLPTVKGREGAKRGGTTKEEL